MEAAQACVLVSVTAPDFAPNNPADLTARAIALQAATRLSGLPARLIGGVAAGVLRYALG